MDRWVGYKGKNDNISFLCRKCRLIEFCCRTGICWTCVGISGFTLLISSNGVGGGQIAGGGVISDCWRGCDKMSDWFSGSEINVGIWFDSNCCGCILHAVWLFEKALIWIWTKKNKSMFGCYYMFEIFNFQIPEVLWLLWFWLKFTTGIINGLIRKFAVCDFPCKNHWVLLFGFGFIQNFSI